MLVGRKGLTSRARILALGLLLLSNPALRGEAFLYFNNAAGPLHRSELDGSNVTSPLGPPAIGTQVGYLAVDHEFLYFSDTAANTLNRINLDGTGATIIADASDGIQSPQGIVRDKFGLAFASGTAGKIQHYNFISGAVTDLATGINQPRGLTRAGTAYIWIEAGTDKIFSSSGGEIATIPAAGGTLFDLVAVSSGPLPTIFATARDRVFRVVDNSPFAPTVTTVHTGTASSFFTGITASDSTVYFNALGENRVYQLPLAGGPATVLHNTSNVSGLSQPGGIDLTPIPEIEINDPVVNEAGGPVNFTVSLSELTSCAVEVAYATMDDSALAPFDYSATTGTLTIPAGAASGLIPVSIVEDGAFEPEEQFDLVLSSPSFGVLADATGIATINNQSNLNGTARYSWGQNDGWTNWRPSPGNDPTRAHVLATFLTGMVWNQNVGWINLGNGPPADGVRFANDSAADFGVNLEPDGSLAGHAWGQNIGWISFEQTHGQPRIDYLTGRFSGHAWSQNCGWITLGPTQNSPGLQADLLEITDSDHDMIDDAWELERSADAGLSPGLGFLSKTGDADGDGVSDLDEFTADSDPFDPLDSLRITSLAVQCDDPVDNIDLTWTSSPARLYDLLNGPGLTSPFALEQPDLPGMGSTTSVSLTESLPLPLTDFWRVEARRPLSP